MAMRRLKPAGTIYKQLAAGKLGATVVGGTIDIP